MKNIGHLVLLSSGDSLSRVMPVQQMEAGVYKISFEFPFLPNTDSLILITMKQLQGYGQFAVELWESKTHSLIYSFVGSADDTETILPCLDRPLPKLNYDIVIRMAEPDSYIKYYLLAGIAILFIPAGWLFYKSRSAKTSLPETLPVDETSPTFINLGCTQFYPELQKIVFENTETELTAKEAEVLVLLADKPNAVVERTTLQKEIWENQGIIVTRSLDVFISRLRKKLSADATVKIVNVHGRGYKLEVGGDRENG